MRVMIASSATGGHIYPALAVTEEIKRRAPETEFLFVGAKWEIGKDIVNAAGYRQVFIEARGFHRGNPFKNVGILLKLAGTSTEIKKILREFRPDVCFGTGGHISGPVIRSAKKAGVRTLIHEQNVIPGMANRLAERYADKVFVGFEETVKHFKNPEKVVVSGNPVRAAITWQPESFRAEMRTKSGVPEDAFCVLIFGGSQGAGAINKAAVDAIRALKDKKGYAFILITGRDYYEETKNSIQTMTEGSAPVPVVCLEYSEEIQELYAAADLIVSRAGALTVTEIAHSGKASILVPSPNVTNNHQYFNAKVLSDAGAAELISEDELGGEGGEKLAGEIERFAADPGMTSAMGRAAASCAKPDAAKVIVDEIFGN